MADKDSYKGNNKYLSNNILSDFNKVDNVSSQNQKYLIDYLDSLSIDPFTKYYMDCSVKSLNLHSGDTLIDIGCGRGFDIVKIAEKVSPYGFVYGIDNSERMLTEARTVNSNIKNVRFIYADGRKLSRLA
nr:methyltransferase domain-containing protein [Calothrix rhizosoleniae]